MPEHNQLLKEVVALVVPSGGRAGSVYQALLDRGVLVSIEECREEVDRLLEQLGCSSQSL